MAEAFSSRITFAGRAGQYLIAGQTWVKASLYAHLDPALLVEGALISGQRILREQRSPADASRRKQCKWSATVITACVHAPEPAADAAAAKQPFSEVVTFARRSDQFVIAGGTYVPARLLDRFRPIYEGDRLTGSRVRQVGSSSSSKWRAVSVDGVVRPDAPNDRWSRHEAWFAEVDAVLGRIARERAIWQSGEWPAASTQAGEVAGASPTEGAGAAAQTAQAPAGEEAAAQDGGRSSPAPTGWETPGPTGWEMFLENIGAATRDGRARSPGSTDDEPGAPSLGSPVSGTRSVSADGLAHATAYEGLAHARPQPGSTLAQPPHTHAAALVERAQTLRDSAFRLHGAGLIGGSTVALCEASSLLREAIRLPPSRAHAAPQPGPHSRRHLCACPASAHVDARRLLVEILAEDVAELPSRSQLAVCDALAHPAHPSSNNPKLDDGVPRPCASAASRATSAHREASALVHADPTRRDAWRRLASVCATASPRAMRSSDLPAANVSAAATSTTSGPPKPGPEPEVEPSLTDASLAGGRSASLALAGRRIVHMLLRTSACESREAQARSWCLLAEQSIRQGEAALAQHALACACRLDEGACACRSSSTDGSASSPDLNSRPNPDTGTCAPLLLYGQLALERGHATIAEQSFTRVLDVRRPTPEPVPEASPPSQSFAWDKRRPT